MPASIRISRDVSANFNTEIEFQGNFLASEYFQGIPVRNGSF